MFGLGPWAICDRCGFKVRLRKLRKEWDGYMVCDPCFDPKPADLAKPPHLKPEGVPLPNARPEPPEEYVTLTVAEQRARL
jgi:hypothetical protein